MKILMQGAIDKLEAAWQTCDVGHNKDFIKSALKSALNVLLVFVLDDSSGIKESFEDAKLLVATALKLEAIVASAFARDTAPLKPTTRYASKNVKPDAEGSAKDLVSTICSSPPSGSDLSSDEVSKSRKDKRFMKKSSRCQSSVFSSNESTWYLKGLMKKVLKSPESFMVSSDTEDQAPKLKILRAASNSLLNVIYHMTYRIFDK